MYEPFPYDEEAVIQDADIQQAEFEAESRRARALKRRGICTHGWQLGAGGAHYSREQIEAERKRAGDLPDRPLDPAVTSQDDIPEGMVVCLDCGELVDDPLAGRR